ncbi:MAG: 50S ribosomal protein L25 [Candidatus Taylorbacteria bacterium]|nr:50S ribosomal protein L25 [Candidatus Taylorbacteria bacterium]
MLSLNVEKRDLKVRADKVRQNARMPAIYYGPKEASTAVTVSMNDFKEVFKQVGESSVIILKDSEAEHEVLIHEVDIHPVSGEPRHADFYVIEKGKKVKVYIPLVWSGVSPAVKDKGGILIKVMREIEVEAAPRDLPRELAVDISKLIELNDTIHAKDISVPAGVELKVSADEVVASVTEAKEEVVEAPALDLSAIEVEAKGKEAKEGEAGAAGAGAAGADAKGATPAAGGAGKKEDKKGGDKK